MADYTFFGKQKLCYTEVADFTDFQGIGHDPMYKRYDSVYSVVLRSIPENYRHFLATPEYLNDVDQICWHIDKWQEYPTRLTELTGAEYDRYKCILNETVGNYRAAIMKLGGEDLQIMAGAIKYIEDDQIFCADGKVFVVAWGMTPDTRMHKVIGSVIHLLDYIKKYTITFDAGQYGSLSGLDKTMTRAEGFVLSKKDIPSVKPSEGWIFDRWDPEPIGVVVKGDLFFTACYSSVIDEIKEPVVDPEPEPALPSVPESNPDPQEFTCRFNAGDFGTIEGDSIVYKVENSRLLYSDIPSVKPNKGYEFVGWNTDPYNTLVDGDKTFTAQYQKVIPWYRRFFTWIPGFFLGRGCFKWLLWLLLFLLIAWLLSWLLRGCVGCYGTHEVNGVIPIDSVKHDGGYVEDNGRVRPITGNDGRLPVDDNVTAPVLGEGGVVPPVVTSPGVPDVIANRLFLFMENEDGDIDALARDFKQAYPGDQYSIIGFDKEVKLLVIQIPEAERDQMRQTLNDQLPNHKFIVFDEEVYNLRGYISDSPEDIGWHLNAIHVKEGWAFTKGSPEVKVAIVDDGIQANHPMFRGRIVDAYNVFTQNNTLSSGEGHGTHTAGLAVGSDEFYEKGASGVAPNCKIMPVQVFDNGMCPLSAIIAGVMYALHHDADVVNISIGPSFKGLNVLPVDKQNEIAQTQFHHVAALWSRVCNIAAQKRCILVFAAGNDDILTSIPPENRNESSIVVTAVDKNMYPTVFTNYGPCSDISAPGKNIYSSFPSSTFQSCDGTSMSAPIVTGTIALMKSLKKDLTVEEARNALFSTGADVYGWIPPMVLVDKVLEATRKGDFSRVNREGKSVPEGVDIHLHSGKIPVDNEAIVDDRAIIVKTPTPVQNTPGIGVDYDAIRRLIDEYKRKIEELEKLLPN